MSESTIKEAYKDEDFTVELEEVEGVLFFHCYVDNFNKTVMKRMYEVFALIKEYSFMHGWDAIHSYTSNPKFAMKLEGAFKIDEFEIEDTTFEVIRWEL